jgi:propanol-preferring alcohol dehydrogenase
MPIHMYWDLVDLIVERQVPLEKMITHHFSIEEAPGAFALFDRGKTGKVIFEWE